MLSGRLFVSEMLQTRQESGVTGWDELRREEGSEVRRGVIPADGRRSKRRQYEIWWTGVKGTWE